jgi:hypothetical protein
VVDDELLGTQQVMGDDHERTASSVTIPPARMMWHRRFQPRIGSTVSRNLRRGMARLASLKSRHNLRWRAVLLR